MTRRRVVFIKKNGLRYISPEFNGDKDEFIAMGSHDSCDKTWDEMIRDIWGNVDSYISFVKANVIAQDQYCSAYGDIFISVCRNLRRNSKAPSADEYLLIKESDEGMTLSTVHEYA